MAITQAVCSSFKNDLFYARHNFNPSGGNAFKISLYTSSATLGATTTAYTATNEVSGTAYTATGASLTVEAGFPKLATSPTTTATVDFVDVTWATSTITARGALIYNDTLTTPVADASVVVLDFGSDKSSTAGDFTIVFPAGDGTNSIIRIA